MMWDLLRNYCTCATLFCRSKAHLASSGYEMKQDGEYIKGDCGTWNDVLRPDTESAELNVTIRRRLWCTLRRRVYNVHRGGHDAVKFLDSHSQSELHNKHYSFQDNNQEPRYNSSFVKVVKIAPGAETLASRPLDDPSIYSFSQREIFLIIGGTDWFVKKLQSYSFPRDLGLETPQSLFFMCSTFATWSNANRNFWSLRSFLTRRFSKQKWSSPPLLLLSSVRRVLSTTIQEGNLRTARPRLRCSKWDFCWWSSVILVYRNALLPIELFRVRMLWSIFWKKESA